MTNGDKIFMFRPWLKLLLVNHDQNLTLIKLFVDFPSKSTPVS